MSWHLSRGLAVVALLCGVACGHSRGAYVWADKLPREPAPEPGYRIAPGDVLAVRVWNQEAMSTPRVRVRNDGVVTLPLLHDVPVAGLTPPDLARQLETKLKTYVVNPVVTVAVEEIRAVQVAILGEVGRPGQYDLDRDAGVLHALAAAGGLTHFADPDRIFVLRSGPGGTGGARVRFTYDALVRGSGPSATYRLRPGDVIVVE